MLPRTALLPGVALVALLSFAPAAQTEDAPEMGRSDAHLDDEAEAIRAVPADPAQISVQFETPRTTVLPATPVGAQAREQYVTLGEDLAPSAPTDRELAKLERARAAIEASRAAGTLFSRPAPGWDPVPDMEALKLDQLRNREPVPLTDDPMAGVGEFAPIQEVGPPGLTPLERDRLEGIATPAPAATVPVEPAPPTHPDGDGAGNGKEADDE